MMIYYEHFVLNGTIFDSVSLFIYNVVQSCPVREKGIKRVYRLYIVWFLPTDLQLVDSFCDAVIKNRTN